MNNTAGHSQKSWQLPAGPTSAYRDFRSDGTDGTKAQAEQLRLTQNLDALIRSLGSAPPKPAAIKPPSAGFSPNTAAEMGALSAELNVIGGLPDREPPAATMPSRCVDRVEMELMELQGALEAERAVNKRLST